MSDLSDISERVVDEAGTEAAVVVTTGDGRSDIGWYVTDDLDEHPVEPSLWMLAVHIDHIRRTAREAGGDATVEHVVAGALERLKASYEEGPDA